MWAGWTLTTPLILRWLKQADGLILKYARSCPHCIEAQQKEVGLSWWVRAHQIPGIDICLHHKVPLIRIPAQDALLQMPGAYLGQSLISSETTPSWDHPTVSRYHEFATWLLSQPERRNAKDFGRCIKARCDELDIALIFKNRVQHSSLSLFVRSKFPVDWLAKHYPVLLSESYQGRELGIDAAFMGQGATGLVITMVLAALFDSPDHFLSILEEKRDRPPRRRSWAPSSNTTFRSQDAFIQAYIKANGKAEQIASFLGCNVFTVHRYLSRYGLPAMGRSRLRYRMEMMQRLSEASTTEIQSWGEAMREHWRRQGGKGHPHRDIPVLASLLGIT